MDRQAKEIADEIRAILRARPSSDNSISCFLFGSVLKGGSDWSDIDVLCVVEDPSELDILRCLFDDLASLYPLHLTLVLGCEVEEFGFEAWGRLKAIKPFGPPY